MLIKKREPKRKTFNMANLRTEEILGKSKYYLFGFDNQRSNK